MTFKNIDKSEPPDALAFFISYFNSAIISRFSTSLRYNFTTIHCKLIKYKIIHFRLRVAYIILHSGAFASNSSNVGFRVD
jgi:hypothetical protein